MSACIRYHCVHTGHHIDPNSLGMSVVNASDALHCHIAVESLSL